MGSIVVDASVVVKWYLPERDHRQARKLRDDYLDGGHDLVAPVLLPFEVINALTYSGQFTDDQIIDASETLPEYGIALTPYRDAGPVARIATAIDCTIYDASYLALAETTDAVVYTADSRLLSMTEGTEYADVIGHIRTYES